MNMGFLFAAFQISNTWGLLRYTADGTHDPHGGARTGRLGASFGASTASAGAYFQPCPASFVAVGTPPQQRGDEGRLRKQPRALLVGMCALQLSENCRG